MVSYLDNMNSILDTYVPFKRVDQHKLRFKTKSWITPSLRKSISVKNSPLVKNFINCNDSPRKEHLRIN